MNTYAIASHDQVLTVMILFRSQEILVSCESFGTFVIYEQGQNKNSWTLKGSCSGNNLGDLSRYDKYAFSSYDIQDACKYSQTHDWEPINEVCIEGRPTQTQVLGMTTVDLNNDGFMDIIVAPSIGFLRFFLYEPPTMIRRNKFIRFQLIGDGIVTNTHAIGSILILYCKNSNNEISSQFRDISSYQYAPDRGGSDDSRITFGLGETLQPDRLEVTWPNGKVQTIDLSNVSNDDPATQIVVRYQSLEISSSPSMIPSELSESPTAIFETKEEPTALQPEHPSYGSTISPQTTEFPITDSITSNGLRPIDSCFRFVIIWFASISICVLG